MKTNKLLIPLIGVLLAGCSVPGSSSIADNSDQPVTSTPGSSETVKAEIDSAELNNYAGFDIYSLLPKIYSSDYTMTDDSSEDYPMDIYIMLFDWDEETAYAYDDALAATFEVTEYGYMINDEIIGAVFMDDENYDSTVYYINLYTVAPVILTPKNEIDPSAINDFFGRDIYSLLPTIYSEDYELYDGSSEEYPVDVYFYCYDWNSADADAFMDAMEAMYEYDDEGYFVEENLYIWCTIDDVNFEDGAVYFIGLYSLPA